MGITKYTQERWIREGRVVEAKDESNNVVMMCSVIGPKAEANAALIVEAPAMFESLEEILAQWDSLDESGPVSADELMERARAIVERIREKVVRS